MLEALHRFFRTGRSALSTRSTAQAGRRRATTGFCELYGQDLSFIAGTDGRPKSLPGDPPVLAFSGIRQCTRLFRPRFSTGDLAEQKSCGFDPYLPMGNSRIGNSCWRNRLNSVLATPALSSRCDLIKRLISRQLTWSIFLELTIGSDSQFESRKIRRECRFLVSARCTYYFSTISTLAPLLRSRVFQERAKSGI
jgi:hypothetical protein